MPAKKAPDGGARPVTPVMEDYLEAIFDLGKEKKAVRVKDIATRLGVKMPTVTSMLKTLRDRELVDYTVGKMLQPGASCGCIDRQRVMNECSRIPAPNGAAQAALTEANDASQLG